jgi:hypothetical protein
MGGPGSGRRPGTPGTKSARTLLIEEAVRAGDRNQTDIALAFSTSKQRVHQIVRAAGLIPYKKRRKQKVRSQRTAPLDGGLHMSQDTTSLLIRLRAEMVRLAHEVEALAELSSIVSIRTLAPPLANKMRDAAMKRELMEAYLRPTPKALKCEDCGERPADYPSKLCPGCEAYREHQA